MSSAQLVLWGVTVAALLAIVALDLVVIGRRSGPVTIRAASLWVSFYVGLALLFGVGLVLFGPAGQGQAFLAGYVTEYSLSVDNLFVFVIIMARFAVPEDSVDKVLYIGIVLSMVLRAICIMAGVAAISAATWTFYLFGAFLIYTAVTLAFQDDDDEEFQEYRLLTLMRRVLPISEGYVERRLVVREEGRTQLTPLVIAIAAIGLANVVFALDSIPAIFGLTTDAYIVFVANAFALMGLRQLYFLVGGLLERISLLNLGLSVILGFIGVKLVLEALEGSHVDHLGAVALPHIGINLSLAVIVVTLAVTVVASLARDRLVRARR